MKLPISELLNRGIVILTGACWILGGAGLIGLGMAVAEADWLGALLAFVGGTGSIVGGTAMYSVGATKQLRSPAWLRELVESSGSPRSPTLGPRRKRKVIVAARSMGLVLFLSAAGATGLSAQRPGGGDLRPPGTANLGIWTGVSWYAPGPSGVQQVGDREFIVVALRYRRVLLAASHFTLAHTIDFVPVAIVTDNSSEAWPFQYSGGGYSLTGLSGFTFAGSPRKGNTVLGVGVTPIGFEGSVWIAQRFAFVLSGSAGVLAFTEPVPFANATKLNMALDIGFGVETDVGNGWGAIMGYKFHHISNAGFGSFNPGLNSDVWYVGALTVW